MKIPFITKGSISLLLSWICITLQILWITPVNTQSKDKCRRTCIEEINNTFNGSCPTPLSCSWECATERFKLKHGDCVGDRVYHCARNSTDKNLLDLSLPRGYAYIEACAPAITCRTGIKQQHVSCLKSHFGIVQYLMKFENKHLCIWIR